MRRPFYLRVAIWALLLVPASLLLLLAALIVVGGRPPVGVVGLLVPLGGACLVLGLLLAWTPRMLLPVAGVSFLLAVMALALGAEFGLSHPESFFDFVTGLVTFVGPAVAGIGAAIAFVQRMLRKPPREPGTVAVRVVGAVPAAVLALAVVSAILTLTQQPVEVAAGDAAEVVTHHDRFVPESFEFESGEFEAGDRMRFVVRNEDSYAHTFSVDALRVDEYIGPRSQRLVSFVADPEGGTYELYCAIIGHEDMTGTIAVVRPT